MMMKILITMKVMKLSILLEKDKNTKKQKKKKKDDDDDFKYFILFI